MDPGLARMGTTCSAVLDYVVWILEWAPHVVYVLGPVHEPTQTQGNTGGQVPGIHEPDLADGPYFWYHALELGGNYKGIWEPQFWI